MTSDFLPSFSPCWVVMFLDSHDMVFTFHSWLDLLGDVLAFLISILKIFKSLQKYWFRVTDITNFEKHLESSSGHWTIVSKICFWRNLSTGLQGWSTLSTMEGQRPSEFRLVGLESHRKYNTVIIERTLGLALVHTALCTLNNNVVRTTLYMTGHIQIASEETRPLILFPVDC